MERVEDLRRLVLEKYDKEGIKALTYKRKKGVNDKKLQKLRDRIIRDFVYQVPEHKFFIREMSRATGLSHQTIFNIKHKR